MYLAKLCDSLSAADIERFVRRWLARLPPPFTSADAAAGYRYELSVLQLEVGCTGVFDRPSHGRAFFEQVITDQLDLGRPEQLQLLLEHRILRNRTAPFRTRVFGAGAQSSLHVEHRHTKIKQYWKLERALRTETTISHAYALAGPCLPADSLSHGAEPGPGGDRCPAVGNRDACRWVRIPGVAWIRRE